MTAKTIILDTDIGGDIDDTWALGMLLNSPELDPKLILTCTADTVYRARLSCKFLEKCGRSDVPVGVGLRFASDGPRETQADWVGEYQLRDYPGTVYENGIQRALEILETCDDVTIIEIGPMTNLAEICRRRPDLIRKCNLVAMAGSIEKGHMGKEGAIAEFNVEQDIEAAQSVWAAEWKNITITPLDTCGEVRLKGEMFRRITLSDRPVPRFILENFRVWQDALKWGLKDQSSVLFDTVAVYLAFTRELLEVETMKLIVDDKGFLRRSGSGRDVDVAIRWKSLESYYDFLTKRLTVSSK